MSAEHFDLLIVGAGLSGVGAGYHLQEPCPGKSYAIFEAREAIGGTWDLFRYPGVRSDSDMFTLGYAFRPWTEAKAIADGPRILTYVRETATPYGIDRQIRFGQRVTRAAWSSQEARWTIEAERKAGEGARDRQLHVRFPVHVRRLLQLRARLYAGVPRLGGFRRPHRASANGPPISTTPASAWW